MKRLAYVGLKVDGERAFKERTGIEWMPGDEHDVQDDAVAAEMLKHTDVWAEVLPKPAALASAPAPAMSPANQDASSLPAWVVKGVELGATDDQLEAVAQAGGPETESGAALWKDATGTDWKAAEALAPAAAAKKATPAKKTARKGK